MTTGERLRFSAADRPYHRAVMAAWRARSAVSARRTNPVPGYRIVEGPA
jgi:hypothetical protein